MMIHGPSQGRKISSTAELDVDGSLKDLSAGCLYPHMYFTFPSQPIMCINKHPRTNTHIAAVAVLASMYTHKCTDGISKQKHTSLHSILDRFRFPRGSVRKSEAAVHNHTPTET